MNNIIREIVKVLNERDENFILTDSQKAILMLVKISATPQQAFEATEGNIKSFDSRKMLAYLGFIQITDNMVYLTQKGEDALINYNLIENDEPTDLGNEILNNFTNSIEDQIKSESVIRELY